MLGHEGGISEVKDPISNSFYVSMSVSTLLFNSEKQFYMCDCTQKEEWQSVALENTLIYERVFRGKIDPTNHITSIDGIPDWRVSVHVHFHTA